MNQMIDLGRNVLEKNELERVKVTDAVQGMREDSVH